MGQDHINPIPRKNETGNARCHVHRDGNGAFTRIENGGEKACLPRLDQPRIGDRFSGDNALAHNRADEIFKRALVLDDIDLVQIVIFGPGLPFQMLFLHQRPRRQISRRHQNLDILNHRSLFNGSGFDSMWFLITRPVPHEPDGGAGNNQGKQD